MTLELLSSYGFVARKKTSEERLSEVKMSTCNHYLFRMNMAM